MRGVFCRATRSADPGKFHSEDFSFTNSINISGIFFTTVAFLPLLRKSDKANVINISSIAAFHISR